MNGDKRHELAIADKSGGLAGIGGTRENDTTGWALLRCIDGKLGNVGACSIRSRKTIGSIHAIDTWVSLDALGHRKRMTNGTDSSIPGAPGVPAAPSDRCRKRYSKRLRETRIPSDR